MSYASDALIDALTHENNQLKDENTKLKEDREHLFQMCLEKNGEILNLLIEAARRRELIRCLVNVENPSDRAKLIADTADVLAEMRVKVPDV